MKNYVLITPVKNEEEYLPYFARSVLNQTISPIIWVIVDGNSSDNSKKIIENICKDYDWIHIKDQSMFSSQKNHLNFAYGVHEGYEYAKQICKEKKLNYKYIAKIDADTIIPINFFESLIEKFEKNPSLGVASGQLYNLSEECTDYVHEKIANKYLERSDYILGELPDKRVYRRKSLEEIGGFPLSIYSPDTVLLAKFKLKNWDVKMFNDVSVYNLRENTGTVRDIWESSKLYGKNRYYLNYNPIVVFSNALILILKLNLRSALAYVIGYSSSVLHRDIKIDDKELRHYFMYRRPIEIVNSLLNNYI